jgi:hypothetical protein
MCRKEKKPVHLHSISRIIRMRHFFLVEFGLMLLPLYVTEYKQM